MKKQLISLFLTFIFTPLISKADINSLYDLEQKFEQIKDSVANSPVYGILFYSISAIAIFVVAILVVFMLIMLLKR